MKTVGKTLLTGCPRSGMVMVGTPHDAAIAEKTRYIFQAPCDKWECPYCGTMKKAQWAMKIFYGVQFYNTYFWDFVTLTSHRKLTTFEATVAVWPSAWEKLSNRIRYKYSPEYALVPERHKDGRMHVHLILGNSEENVKRKWLKDASVSSGLGYMVDTQKLDNPKKAAWYVTKYLAKSLNDTAWPAKFRRIRTSRGWPEMPDKNDFEPLEVDWKPIFDTRLQEVQKNLTDLGRTVIVLGRGNHPEQEKKEENQDVVAITPKLL